MIASIDLNADLGESFGSWTMGADDQLLEVVSSANVACGFHAGDALVLDKTLRLAAENNVNVGAHVAYRDLAGFGRNFIDVEPARLRAEIIYQLGAITTAARVAGTAVTYVKPHGALYNTIVHHEAQAHAVVDALSAYNDSRPDGEPALGLLGLPGGVVLKFAADAGIATYLEAFADRGYRADGTLVPRREPGAVLHDPAQIAERMLRMINDGVIEAVDGTLVPLKADSICLHGDNAEAVESARSLRQALTDAGVEIRSFTS